MRPQLIATLAALLILLIGTTPRVLAADAAKQLVRVGGTVEYQHDPQDALHQLFGRLDLPDNATAVTLADSRALVRLVDSTEIDIGAKTRVRIGAFNAAETGQPTVVTLELGAIHFTVRHPAGGRANYTFLTPTSQIAVRGTEGYIVTGPTGTNFYCVACTAGDVTVTVGAHTYPMAAGQQLFVVGTDQSTAKVDLVNEPCGNPAAIAISDGKLGRTIPPAQQVDLTGSQTANPLTPVAVPIPPPNPHPATPTPQRVPAPPSPPPLTGY